MAQRVPDQEAAHPPGARWRDPPGHFATLTGRHCHARGEAGRVYRQSLTFLV